VPQPLTSEQRQLRAVVRQFLSTESDEAAVRSAMATGEGTDTATWNTLSGQLGLTGLALPERYGGAGTGFSELVIVLEEMGRSLLCSPFFATVVLAAQALLLSGDEQACASLLPRMAAGTTRGTVAFSEPSRPWELTGLQTCGTANAGGWALSGHKNLVMDGHTAEVIIVLAQTSAGPTLFRAGADAPGLIATPGRILDQTRKLAELSFDRVPAQPVGDPGAGATTLARVLDLAAIALAAEQVGGAQRCLDMAVGHAKARVQFGRPIGAYQAIKHRCADLLVDVESARSAAYFAGECATSGSSDLGWAASLAKICCSEL
jgi:alkylation response protein AidB-like acyl-CoA dehydrogenase